MTFIDGSGMAGFWPLVTSANVAFGWFSEEVLSERVDGLARVRRVTVLFWFSWFFGFLG